MYPAILSRLLIFGAQNPGKFYHINSIQHEFESDNHPVFIATAVHFF